MLLWIDGMIVMVKRVMKPWGWEDFLVENEYYRIKRLHVNAGCRNSLQRHREKVETLIYPNGDVVHVPPLKVHRLEAPPDHDVDILEVSHGRDEDVERLEDDYGRTEKKPTEQR
jgi:mannose-6-phosphate isomerase-like protein (cupin superfamily)